MAQNLKKAMAMEKSYRKLRNDRTAKDKFGYHDKLKEFGFADTVEYERAKGEYWIRTEPVKVINITQEESVDAIGYAITNKITTMLMAIPNKTVAYVGNSTVINKDYCDANDIPVKVLNRGGGVIVSNPADFAYVYITQHENMLDLFLDKSLAILQMGGKEVVVDGNDFLIDGYKVAAIGTVGNYAYCTQFSFSVDIEKINAISTKPMIKQPKGISELCSLTRDDVIKEVLKWLP